MSKYYCVICGYKLDRYAITGAGVPIIFSCIWAGCPRGGLLTDTFSDLTTNPDPTGKEKNLTRLKNTPITVYNKDWKVKEIE